MLYRACLDLPSAACPPPARLPTPEWRCMAWPVPKPIREPGAALLACSRLVRHTAYPSDVGGAEQCSPQSPHTLVFAHASATTGMGRCANVCLVDSLPGVKRSIGWTEECVGVRSVCVRSPRPHAATQCNTVDQSATRCSITIPRSAGTSTSSASGRSFRFCTKPTPLQSCSCSTVQVQLQVELGGKLLRGSGSNGAL